MKKYWKVLSSITLAALLMTACGTGGDGEETKGGGSDQSGYETPTDNQDENNKDAVTEEQVSAEVQKIDGNYTFTLKNISVEAVDLSFSSTQEYEYHLYDEAGNHIYTYSMDKMFGEMFMEKTLSPNEEYTINVDVEVLSTLESGTYQLKIWSVALESDGLDAKMEITIDEAATQMSGTYSGQIDNNSVEIIDADGVANAYRLSDNVREFVEALKGDENIAYSYFEQDGQLILTMIDVVE